MNTYLHVFDIIFVFYVFLCNAYTKIIRIIHKHRDLIISTEDERKLSYA